MHENHEQFFGPALKFIPGACQFSSVLNGRKFSSILLGIFETNGFVISLNSMAADGIGRTPQAGLLWLRCWENGEVQFVSDNHNWYATQTLQKRRNGNRV